MGSAFIAGVLGVLVVLCVFASMGGYVYLRGERAIDEARQRVMERRVLALERQTG